MKKEKVVHIVFSLTTGGAELLLIDILNSQASSFDLTLIVINKEYDKQLFDKIDNKVKIILIDRERGKLSIGALLKLNQVLVSTNPYAIHCHNENIIRYVFYKRNRTILTIHNVNRPLPDLYNYKKLIAISNAVRDDIRSRSNGKLDATTVYNAIAIEKFALKQSYLLNNCSIVQISRLLHSQKGQDILLRAFEKVLKEIPEIPLQLTFIGVGPSLEYLQQLSRELGIDSSVTFLGNIEREWIYQNLKNYDILIQPSRFEGFGITIIEAMASKVPVIAANLDGPVEILNKGEFGELFTPENVNDLAEKIKRSVSQIRDQSIQGKTEAAYEFVRSNFSLDQMILKYNELYHKMNQ